MKNTYTNVRDAQKRQRLKKRRYSLEYLSSHPCVDCGETNPVVLEYDHRRDKKFNIGTAISSSNLSWEKIKLEIEKCDVRCANCHRKRHAKINNWYDFSELDAYEKKIKDWHGTKNGYSYHHCRCERCRLANKESHKKYIASIG